MSAANGTIRSCSPGPACSTSGPPDQLPRAVELGSRAGSRRVWRLVSLRSGSSSGEPEVSGEHDEVVVGLELRLALEIQLKVADESELRENAALIESFAFSNSNSSQLFRDNGFASTMNLCSSSGWLSATLSLSSSSMWPLKLIKFLKSLVASFLAPEGSDGGPAGTVLLSVLSLDISLALRMTTASAGPPITALLMKTLKTGGARHCSFGAHVHLPNLMRLLAPPLEDRSIAEEASGAPRPSANKPVEPAHEPPNPPITWPLRRGKRSQFICHCLQLSRRAHAISGPLII